MEKKYRHEFPGIMSMTMNEDLSRWASFIVWRFSNELKPILLRLSLWDNEHIRKYLNCDSTEEIYRDAMKIDKSRLNLVEEIAESYNEDFWKPLRKEECEAKSPRERAFRFAPMIAEEILPWQRAKVLQCITVQDCRFTISEQAIREQSIIEPSERHRELFDLVATFCEALNMKNFSRKDMRMLFYNDSATGNLQPNARGILFGNAVISVNGVQV